MSELERAMAEFRAADDSDYMELVRLAGNVKAAMRNEMYGSESVGMSYGQHRAIEAESSAVIESPMSFTGAYRRTRGMFDPAGTAYWPAVIATLTLWWLAVAIDYLIIVAFVCIPLAWIVPYRVMRQRQRRERAMRTDYYRRQLQD